MLKKGGTRDDCTPPLEQHTGTCYFNSVLNAVLISKNIQQICLRKLKNFIITLEPKESYIWNDTDSYCMDVEQLKNVIPNFESDQKLINYISLYSFYTLLKAWFCYYQANPSINESKFLSQYHLSLTQESKQKRNQPIELIIQSIQELSVDGNFSLIVMDRIFRLLYTYESKKYYTHISYNKFIKSKNLSKELNNKEIILIHQYTETTTIREALTKLFNLAFIPDERDKTIGILKAIFDTTMMNFDTKIPDYKKEMKEILFDITMNIYTVFPKKDPFKYLFNETKLNTYLNNFQKNNNYTDKNLITDLITTFKYNYLLEKNCIFYTLPNRQIVDILEIENIMNKFPEFELDHVIINLHNDIGGHSILGIRCNGEYKLIDPDNIYYPIIQDLKSNWSNGSFKEIENSDYYKDLFNHQDFQITYEYVCYVRKQQKRYITTGCVQGLYPINTQFIYKDGYSTVTLIEEDKWSTNLTVKDINNNKLIIPRSRLVPIFQIHESS